MSLPRHSSQIQPASVSKVGFQDIRAESPYLMPDLWTLIFQKTNLWTCLENRRFEAAKVFLQGRIARDKALRQAVSNSQSEHLKILVCSLYLHSKDVRHSKTDIRDLQEYKRGPSSFPSTLLPDDYQVVRKQEYSLMELAIRQGRMKALEWLVTNRLDDSCSEDVLKHMLEHGPLAAVRYLYESRKDLLENLGIENEFNPSRENCRDAICSAASGHQYGILKFLLKIPKFRSGNAKLAAELAAEHGNIRAIKLLMKLRPDCDYTMVVECAIHSGQQKVVEWLAKYHRHLFTWESIKYMMEPYWARPGILKVLQESDLLPEDFASRIPSVSCADAEILAWLEESYPSVRITIDLWVACLCGGPNKMKFLFQRGENLELDHRNLLDSAADNFGLPLVQWLFEHGAGFTDEAMDNAKDLETMKYLHGKGASCTSWAMRNAAEKGHLSTVEWLDENRPQGTTCQAMNQAAINGHLEVVKWLLENGYGCMSETISNALWKGHSEIVAFLWKNRPDLVEPTAEVVFDNGEQTTLKRWLETGANEKLESLHLTRNTRGRFPKVQQGIQCYPQGFTLQVACFAEFMYTMLDLTKFVCKIR